MNKWQLKKTRTKWVDKNIVYKMEYWTTFDYSVLSNVMNYYKRGGKKGRKQSSYNDIIIMADTETSKAKKEPYIDAAENHVVCWSIAIRFLDHNIVTLWGFKPSEFIECVSRLIGSMNGEETYIYFHNLAYDYVFLRKFMFRVWGWPIEALNNRPHNPLFIEFKYKRKRIIFRDSLILAQRRLEKWAEDMDVEHKKAVGFWEYDKIRHQNTFKPTDEELKYIECDVLAGVECIDATLKLTNKNISSVALTATGIVRDEVRKIAESNRGHQKFLSCALDFDQYLKCLKVYHGGYTHANRYFIDVLITAIYENIRCYDFASSYPFCMLACKYPSGKFLKFEDCNHRFILENEENYAYMFKFSAVNIRLKDDLEPMPALQESKLINSINTKVDNGRVWEAAYISIYLTEQDLAVISEQYIWDNMDDIDCTEVEIATKAYLPRWFTDYIYALFIDKCKLRGVDPILYNIQKGKINSMYGLCCQKAIMADITENYITGEYTSGIPYLNDEETKEAYDLRLYAHNKKKYNKFCNKRSTVLNYQTGCWVTAYAFRHLHMLGACVHREYWKAGPKKGKLRMVPQWYYSDTDSAYSDKWDIEKIERYNQRCKDMLLKNGYGPVKHEGKEYWLGVAETEDLKDEYTEFKVMGSKRYAGRNVKTGKLKITVAGVPKKGACCLKDDINLFTKDLIFPGEETGKLGHYYIYRDDIYIDEFGNEVGDSIDLKPCEYRLDSTEKWDFIEEEEYYLPIFEEAYDE